MEDELLKISEVAKQLRVDDTTVRRWVRVGILDVVSLPRRGKKQYYRIRRATLDTILQQTPVR